MTHQLTADTHPTTTNNSTMVPNPQPQGRRPRGFAAVDIASLVTKSSDFSVRSAYHQAVQGSNITQHTEGSTYEVWWWPSLSP